jgi:hypothetical protein
MHDSTYFRRALDRRYGKKDRYTGPRLHAVDAEFVMADREPFDADTIDWSFVE